MSPLARWERRQRLIGPLAAWDASRAASLESFARGNAVVLNDADEQENIIADAEYDALDLRHRKLREAVKAFLDYPVDARVPWYVTLSKRETALRAVLEEEALPYA